MIDQMLRADLDAPRKQRHTATRVYDRLVAVLAMLAALGGLLARRRWGMGLSLVAAGMAVVLVAGCPLSGHHHFGLWWVGEFAGMVGWATVSVAGLRCPRDTRRAARATWR